MTIDKETYESIRSMLESPDKENLIVAMTTLENLNFKRNIVPILLLVQRCNLPRIDWITYAPKVVKNIEAVYNGLSFTIISFSSLNTLKFASLYKVSVEHIQLIFEYYCNDLVKRANELPNVQLNLEVEVKIKPHEG